MPSPSVIQTKGAGQGSASSILTSPTSSVVAGHQLIVGIATYIGSGSAITTNTPTDTASGGTNTYTKVAEHTVTTGAVTAYTVFYLATAKGSESLTITSTFSGTAAESDIYFIEASNAPFVSSATGSCNSSCGTAVAIDTPSSLSFAANNLVISMEIATSAISSYGTGFTGITTSNSDGLQYSTTVSSPTTFPMTLGVTGAIWNELATNFGLPTPAAVFFESGPKRQYRRGNQRAL